MSMKCPVFSFRWSLAAGAISAAVLLASQSLASHAQDRLPWLRDQTPPSQYEPEPQVQREPIAPSYGSSAPRAGDYSSSGYDRNRDVYTPSPSPGRYATPSLPPYREPEPVYRAPTYPDRGREYANQDWRDDRPHPRDAYRSPPPHRDHYREPPPHDGTFSMDEIVRAGHGFFGSISQGLASVIEYAFKRQGRPNGYILGEDVGGAFVAGLRYGEGRLYTRDAGTHKVYWQGPSIGYDAGAEGSKVMVLVYKLRDPSDIYQRFGGVAGSAYVVGGVGLTFQQRNHIVLAPIRAGVGFRLGANVGYLKYTRRPTWNPF